MKKLAVSVTALLLIILIFSVSAYPVVIIQRAYFTGNNICNFWQNTGIFNQDTRTQNTPGFVWPCGSANYYVYTSGLSVAGFINNEIAMIACSHQGELAPGYWKDSMRFCQDEIFKIYMVKKTDNASGNPDYANWFKMVPFGAPYEDVNNNCVYDNGIDKPGVPDASQTLFIAMGDGDVSQRDPGEGFGGGVVSPLFGADVRLTVWSYEISSVLNDAQYFRYQIINKGRYSWDSIYFSVYSYPNISPFTGGHHAGCDTLRNLGYAYSGDTMGVYGAYGIRILKGPIDRKTGDTLYMTAFTLVRFVSSICQWSVSGVPFSAYYYMSGYKADGTFYLDPTYTPPRKTKFVFSGDPESNTGWTPLKGYIDNCNGQDTGVYYPIIYPGDRRFIISTGSKSLSIAPADTQTLYYSQMVAKGVTNPNSVTKLRFMSDKIDYLFKNWIVGSIEKNCCYLAAPVPEEFFMSDNYPNPFNNVTVIRYGVPRTSNVRLTVYDMLGREVKVLDEGMKNAGYYEAQFDGSSLASGIYLCRLDIHDFTSNNNIYYSRIRKMVLLK